MTIKQQDVLEHHEGDAAELVVTVEDDDGNIMDLTGAEVKWLLLEDKTDQEPDAVLTKDGVEDGTVNGVEFSDPTNGEVKIIINTDETDDLVNWENFPDDTRQYHHRLRVIDTDGRRVTAFVGRFEVVA